MKKQSSAVQNTQKSWIILCLFILFSATIGFLIGKTIDYGLYGGLIAFILALMYGILAYQSSDTLIISTLQAKKIIRENNVHLYQKVQELAEKFEVTPPQLYYMDDPAMNVLSIGRSEAKSKIIMTTGLIEKLSSPEIEAVFAHELAHIKLLDIQTGSLATTIIGFFSFYAEVMKRSGRIFLPISFVLSLFSPLSALLMHLVVSPKREFEADAAGMLITRYPEGLSLALEKISSDHHTVAAAMNATAHLFIVHPFSQKAHRANPLFQFHPPIKERLQVLASL